MPVWFYPDSIWYEIKDGVTFVAGSSGGVSVRSANEQTIAFLLPGVPVVIGDRPSKAAPTTAAPLEQ